MNGLPSLPGLQDDGAGGAHFGNPRQEAAAALERTVIAPLAHLGVIAVRGPDSATFLQGQLSNDVRKLAPGRAQLSSYNSPKGRMLAVLHLYRDADSIFLELHASVLAAVLKRLRMYVLRAKATLDDATALHPALGLCGPDAAALLRAAGLPVPAQVLDVAWEAGHAVIRRQDAAGRPRYTVHPPADAVAGLWRQWAPAATAAGTAAWRLLDIEAGIPVVYPETSDRFVPQMCNLDQLGGISFDKGCYTGQEIVARVHYRGAIKRRMLALRHADPALRPGTRLQDPAGAEVVDAAPAPEGGARALVVAPEAAAG